MFCTLNTEHVFSGSPNHSWAPRLSFASLSGRFDIDLDLQALTINAACIFCQATLKTITYGTASRHYHGCPVYL